MTPRQIELVRQSWREAQPIADTVVRLFYRRLFETTPELREQFVTSMSEQSDSLLAAVEELLDRLEGNEAPDAAADDRGLTEAWIWALEAELGSRCNFEVTDAWREALNRSTEGEFHSVALGAAVMV